VSAHVAFHYHHHHHNYSRITKASTVICSRYLVPPLTLTTISQSFRAKPRCRTRLVRTTTSHKPSPSVGPYNSEHTHACLQSVIPSATHIRRPKQLSIRLEMPNIHRTVPSLPELPSPFNNNFDVYTTSSLFDSKPAPKPTKMSSHQTSSPDRKQSKASETSSILSTSTTSSMTALLKSKFTPKSKQGKPVKLEDELSPGEKQALRRQDRMDPRILATIASLK
jgi:hypothetical protein